MTFYIYVRSGINNKLVPLLSLLRIAKKENRKIKCCWGEDAYINKSLFSFLDLFKNINDIEFINMNEYINVFNNVNNKIYNRDGSDRNRNEIIYKKDPNNIIVFNKIVHLISYKEDNVIGNYVPYPRENKETTQIISELRDIVKDLIPVQEIQNKINETTNTFKNKNVIGLHVRTTDGGFTDIPYKDVFGFINKLLNEDNNKDNKDKKVYVSCDNLSLENEIKETFSNKVLFFSNPFGSNYADKFNRSSSGTINAVCEMFILSRCNKFYGTPGSSLSFMVWLLRSDKFLDFWCKNPWN